MVPKISRRTLVHRTLRLRGVGGMGIGMGMGMGMGMGTIIIIIATVGDIIIITTVGEAIGGHGAMAGVTGSATWAFSK